LSQALHVPARSSFSSPGSGAVRLSRRFMPSRDARARRSTDMPLQPREPPPRGSARPRRRLPAASRLGLREGADQWEEARGGCPRPAVRRSEQSPAEPGISGGARLSVEPPSPAERCLRKLRLPAKTASPKERAFPDRKALPPTLPALGGGELQKIPWRSRARSAPPRRAPPETEAPVW